VLPAAHLDRQLVVCFRFLPFFVILVQTNSLLLKRLRRHSPYARIQWFCHVGHDTVGVERSKLTSEGPLAGAPIAGTQLAPLSPAGLFLLRCRVKIDRLPPDKVDGLQTVAVGLKRRIFFGQERREGSAGRGIFLIA
jgi:hypothetical protein